MTQRRLERYGDTPDAWRIERCEYLERVGLGDVPDDPRAIWRARLRQLGGTPEDLVSADGVERLMRRQLRMLGIDLPPFAND